MQMLFFQLILTSFKLNWLFQHHRLNFIPIVLQYVRRLSARNILMVYSEINDNLNEVHTHESMNLKSYIPTPQPEMV